MGTGLQPAYDAGCDVATGDTLMGIGSVLFAAGLGAAIAIVVERVRSGDANSVVVGTTAVVGLLGASFVVGGALLHVRGKDAFNKADAAWSAGGGMGGGAPAFVVPLGSFSW